MALDQYADPWGADESFECRTPCLEAGEANLTVVDSDVHKVGLRGTRLPTLLAAASLLGLGVAAAGLVVLRLRPGTAAHQASGAVKMGEPDSVVSLVGTTWTNVRWLAHPTKCLDVGGTKKGAALQIWDCDPNYPYQQQLIVPPDGTTGRIKWAQNPNLCLDSPGGHGLQFWECDGAPAENLLWTISPDGEGRIHWAAHPEQCVDVPEEHLDNGWKLQVWWCANTTAAGRDNNLRFVTHPVDCEWGSWEEWGPCSIPCGGGQHLRSRSVRVQAMNGGKDCGINSDESEHCNRQPCSGSGGAGPAAGQAGATAHAQGGDEATAELSSGGSAQDSKVAALGDASQYRDAAGRPGAALWAPLLLLLVAALR